MKQFLVIALVTCSFVTCDSDQSSSQESYESSEELFGEPKYHMQCVDFVNAEDVESCFAKKCEAECATSNIRVAKGSKVFSLIVVANNKRTTPDCAGILWLGLC